MATALDAQRRNYDIAVFDLNRGLPQKLTTSAADEIRPVWSPDGRYIAFGRRSDAGLAMYRKRADGTGSEELLLDGASPVDWSADGRHILFLGRAGPTMTRADLWVFSMNGGVTVRWRRDSRELFYGEPDGTVVAVAVDGTGSAFEVKESQRLFQLRVRPVGRPGDGSADGQRFLVNTLTEEAFDAPITLVVNWPALMFR